MKIGSLREIQFHLGMATESERGSDFVMRSQGHHRLLACCLARESDSVPSHCACERIDGDVWVFMVVTSVRA